MTDRSDKDPTMFSVPSGYLHIRSALVPKGLLKQVLLQNATKNKSDK